MKYKLVAIDLDGTLLKNDHRLSPRSMDIIKRLDGIGIKIILCSGRSEITMMSYYEKLDIQTPIISENGACITCQKETLYSNSFSTTELLELLHLIDQVDREVYCQFVHEKVLIASQLEFVSLAMAKYNVDVPREKRIDIYICNDLVKYVDLKKVSTYKVSLISNNAEVLRAIRQLLMDTGGYEITSSDKNNIEIMKCDISKGTALKILTDHLKIPLSQCVAIGNSANDAGMIEMAGLGIAMKNSGVHLKSISKRVTEYDNEEDGVACLLEQLFS